MIGHGGAEAEVIAGWRSGRLHHAWLLAGPQGMGKAAFAARAARFLVTREPGTSPDDVRLDDPGNGVADRLVTAGNHPEILLLTRQPKEKGKELARNITIDQVRAMIRKLHLTISLGLWRVIIIDAIDDLETDAINALLKTLEEPPANTLFLLVSHSPGRLLPTIRSRCRTLRFQPLDRDSMTSWLRNLRPMMDIGDLQAVVNAAGGVPGRAIALIDSDVGQMEKKLMAIALSGDADNSLREALAREVGGIANKAKLELLLNVVPSLLAEIGRQRPTSGLGPVLDQWEHLQSSIRNAIRGSYDGAMIGFEVGNCLASLARPEQLQSA